MSLQSGALGLAILSLAVEREIGVSTFVSVGNKADVSGNDLLEYWEIDENTNVILLYLESFGNPRRFARIARRVGRVKPIVAVKAGRTIAGGRAAGSHTAALAANDVAVDALFRQTGVIRAETLDVMFEIAVALEKQPLIQGRRVAIVTNAGGPGILCTDACEAGGLRVPELSRTTKERLQQFLPVAASVSNPVDMIASAGPETYRQAIAALLPSTDIDALIILYIPVDREGADAVVEAVREGIQQGREAGGTGNPVFVCMMVNAGSRSLALPDETIPVYLFPESPARVLSKTIAYSEWRRQPSAMVPGFADIQGEPAKAIVRNALRQRGPGWLAAAEVRDLLNCYQIPQTPGELARTAEEAITIARALGLPVAAKLASPQVIHKSDVGAIRLNLSSETAVRQAFEEMRQDGMEGILVQRMVGRGVEVMIGVADDPLFGPLLAFGLGGIHVEILADVRFRVTPLSDQDAHEMVREIRGYRLLEGYRGHDPADVAAIEDVLLRISRMVEDIPEIRELDLNPIFALPPGQGCSVVDARIRVG
jgi:acyl-CoA synthetase (NDP forming)